MACRCAERREAIVAGVRALRAGEGLAVRRELAFVAASSAGDAARMAASALAAAKARLKR